MNCRLGFLFLISISVITAVVLTRAGSVYARTEQVLDASNNNLMISMEVPDDWNSGKLSMTVLNINWKLNGLFATNFATKLFGSSDESIAFFAVINAPSLANAAIPIAQKLGLISLLLSQYVTINRESDSTLSDGSSAHKYFITASYDQIHKLKAPIDKAIQATLITTQQKGKTYIVIFGTEQGRTEQYQSVLDNILDTVNIGSASFSNIGSSPASIKIAPTSETGSVPKVSENAVPGNDTQILLNDTNIGNPAHTCLETPNDAGC
jgi:hypothetical protein